MADEQTHHMERQAEPTLAVLLTEREYQLTVQLLQASQIPFGAATLATAVDVKFRNAQRVASGPLAAPPDPVEKPKPARKPRAKAKPEG